MFMGIFSFSSVMAQSTDPNTDILTNLEYIASYPDLMNAFGTNWQAGSDHYYNYGIDEGRQTTFDTCNYLASNPDLLNSTGTDYVAAVTQYITQGRYQNRAMSFSGLQYMLANPDVFVWSQADSQTACSHYLSFGRFDGHLTTPGRLLVGLGNKCLDAGSIVPTIGSQVAIWDCIGNQPPQQQWIFQEDGRIVGLGGNCLSKASSSSDNGTALVMMPCQGDDSVQTWRLAQDNSLVSADDESKCVDIAGLSTTNGTKIWLWDCWGGAGQKWSVSAGIALVGPAGKCLDAGATFATNSTAVVFSCYPYVPQQQWVFVQGQIKGIGGQCLSIKNSVLANGVPIDMEPCRTDGAASGQNWYLTSANSIASIDAPGLCVSATSANAADGTPLAAVSCSPSTLNAVWFQH